MIGGAAAASRRGLSAKLLPYAVWGPTRQTTAKRWAPASVALLQLLVACDLQSHCVNDLQMKGAIQVLHHEQQQLKTCFWMLSLLCNAQHAAGPFFAAECKPQYHLCHTPESSHALEKHKTGSSQTADFACRPRAFSVSAFCPDADRPPTLALSDGSYISLWSATPLQNALSV